MHRYPCSHSTANTYCLGRWSHQKHHLQIRMHLHRSPSWTPPRWIPRSLRLHLRREEDLVSRADAAAPIVRLPNSQLLGSGQCKELKSLKTQTTHFVRNLLNPVTARMLFEDPHPYQRTKSSHLPFPLSLAMLVCLQ